MKKLTKVLLIIITIFFISISITSCGKKEKIRYEYHYIDFGFNTNIVDTNITANKCENNNTCNTQGSILYSTYKFTYFSLSRCIIDVTNNVKIGLVYIIKNKEIEYEVKKEDINLLTPVSTDDGLNKYDFYINKFFCLVVMADNEVEYTIHVEFDHYNYDEEIDVNRLMEYDGTIYNAYKIEGNNNVYCLENDFGGSIGGNLYIYNALMQKNTNYITFFTYDFETTGFTLNFPKTNITTDKLKLKITKVDEYNILDIIDDDGRAFIPGDINEWVVVKVPDDLDYSFIHSDDHYNTNDVYAVEKSLAFNRNDGLKNDQLVMGWNSEVSEVIDREICIRKGENYRFVKCPKLYLEVNGKTYNEYDYVKLQQGDLVGAYEIVDGTKKYYSFDLKCNNEINDHVVSFMSLSEDGPVEVTKTNEELKNIKYIEFESNIFRSYKNINNEQRYASIRNTYKVTNGEA